MAEVQELMDELLDVLSTRQFSPGDSVVRGSNKCLITTQLSPTTDTESSFKLNCMQVEQEERLDNFSTSEEFYFAFPEPISSSINHNLGSKMEVVEKPPNVSNYLEFFADRLCVVPTQYYGMNALDEWDDKSGSSSPLSLHKQISELQQDLVDNATICGDDAHLNNTVTDCEATVLLRNKNDSGTVSRTKEVALAQSDDTSQSVSAKFRDVTTRDSYYPSMFTGQYLTAPLSKACARKRRIGLSRKANLKHLLVLPSEE